MASLNGDRLPWAAGTPSPPSLAFPPVSDPWRLEPAFVLVPSGPNLTSKPGALEQTGSHVPSCLQQRDTIHIPHLVLPGNNIL